MKRNRQFKALSTLAKNTKLKDQKLLIDVENEMLKDGSIIFNDFKNIESDLHYYMMSSFPYTIGEKPKCKIEELWIDCLNEGCKSTSCKMNVPSGCLHPDVMIIGECPGQANLNNSDTHRTMSFGEVAMYLRKTMYQLGIYNVWYTNLVKCSVAGNRKVSVDEVYNCSSWLKLELKLLKPKTLIILGNNAKEMFDEVHEVPKGTKVVYAYHPAYYIRRGLSWKEYYKHIKALLNQK